MANLRPKNAKDLQNREFGEKSPPLESLEGTRKQVGKIPGFKVTSPKQAKVGKGSQIWRRGGVWPTPQAFTFASQAKKEAKVKGGDPNGFFLIEDHRDTE